MLGDLVDLLLVEKFFSALSCGDSLHDHVDCARAQCVSSGTRPCSSFLRLNVRARRPHFPFENYWELNDLISTKLVNLVLGQNPHDIHSDEKPWNDGNLDDLVVVVDDDDSPTLFIGAPVFMHCNRVHNVQWVGPVA